MQNESDDPKEPERPLHEDLGLDSPVDIPQGEPDDVLLTKWLERELTDSESSYVNQRLALSARWRERLAELEISNIEFKVADATQECDLKDRIDVIVATAALVTVPDDYKQLLTVGGRMLVAVGKEPVMSVQIIHRSSEWEWQTETVFETLIPPMLNAEPKPEFNF